VLQSGRFAAHRLFLCSLVLLDHERLLESRLSLQTAVKILAMAEQEAKGDMPIHFNDTFGSETENEKNFVDESLQDHDINNNTSAR